MPRVRSLHRDISPPPLKKVKTNHVSTRPNASQINDDQTDHTRSAAAIESGQIEISDHLTYFSTHLESLTRPAHGPRIAIEDYRSLYNRNRQRHGCHFVIHQHDHPIAGVHYDLRLQFSATSTISFAIPYGLPLNPNSTRPNRIAVETRVHNLWNNLIESASHATGSILIWDTGEYEVLDKEHLQRSTDDESSDVESQSSHSKESQSERLFKAFQSRYIRLRLNGVRLPSGCTLTLRLPSANDKIAQATKRKRKRRRAYPTRNARLASRYDSDENHSSSVDEARSNDGANASSPDLAADLASEDEADAVIRTNNAYPGATNSIGSVHQRYWFLTLDRRSSGFRKAGSGPDAGRWIGDWDAIVVRGRDHERSIVTGRLADDVMADAGVTKFVGRKMWSPITE